MRYNKDCNLREVYIFNPVLQFETIWNNYSLRGRRILIEDLLSNFNSYLLA